VIPLGFTLQPDDEYLDLLGDLLAHDVDYYEIAPETTWWADEAGCLHPNGFHRRFAALGARTHKPFVAHGVGLSMGTSSARDVARRRRWIARLIEDQRLFRFRWYTDHLGASSVHGLAAQLPLPLPMTAHAAAIVRNRLRSMQRIVPHVGIENNVAYFVCGDPLEEPGFLRRILRGPGVHLLLDLHNVYTMATNFGFDPTVYLAQLDLARVIEIHLSGGADSAAEWLPSRRVMRLDSHNSAIPEPVWDLFAQVLPRCRHLRGVTIERMEGTVQPEDVALLEEEIRRARAQLERCA
jgi:uncharacterized protein (UPF0276 family)